MSKVLITAAIVAAATIAAIPPLSFAAPILITAPEGDHKHGEGEMHKLGRQKIGDYTVSVIMMGEAEAGKDAAFDIKLIDAKTEPKAIRVWIGSEAGTGSEKATAAKKEKTYDADVKVPSPIPAGAKVWVEVETDAGISKGSFAMEDSHNHKH